MQELSQADLVTKARNTEGTMVLVVDAEGENERLYCCNPTDEMRQRIAEDEAAEAERDAEEAAELQAKRDAQTAAVQANAEESTENDDASDSDGDDTPDPAAA